MAQVESFKVDVSDEVLKDLRERLDRTRFPDEVPDTGWEYGTNLAYMKELVEYWRTRYDWRKHEAELNRFAHYKTNIDGLDIHFIHEPGRGPNPKPLLLSHGWPGSVYEFMRIIPMLTDPAAHGGDPNRSFTVIAPSLPGYGFSGHPRVRASIFRRSPKPSTSWSQRCSATSVTARKAATGVRPSPRGWAKSTATISTESIST